MHFKEALILIISLWFCFGQSQNGIGSPYYAGYTNLKLTDSSRIYKPSSSKTDKLHYRPLELDIWYPSSKILDGAKPMNFGDLFQLFEERANTYQEETDYSGMTDELAMFYVAELGVEADGRKLLEVKTSSFENAEILKESFPLVLYMAGFNGMGFENYKLLETLASKGYVVVSISSVGRYPGDMTNELGDTMEQVYDAEFAIDHLRKSGTFNIDFSNMGVLGTSWGGMSAAILAKRNPQIKAMLSLDGSETHYFGDSSDTNNYANEASWQDNDEFIQEIYDTQFKDVESLQFGYLYFESGDKLNDFIPTKEYHFYKKLNSEEYYIRFENGEHANFSCIPAILNASEEAITIYQHLEEVTATFFDRFLRNGKEFETVYNSLGELEYAANQPFDIKNLETSKGQLFKLSGTILDKKTKGPLAYVNIGILNEAVGTVSDTLGKFHLQIEDEFQHDTLRISSIGYKPIDFVLSDLWDKPKPIEVALEEQISELNEVIVSAKSFKRKTLGNKTESKFIGTGFSYDQLGAEMGIRINVRRNPTYVDAFNFTISHNRLSAKSIVRLNFYTVEKGKPARNILSENILIPIEPKQTGPITIDLKPYDVILKEDVILSLEWVANEGENKEGEAIFFPLGFFTNGTLRKEASQSKFKKFASLGVGFNIDVRF